MSREQIARGLRQVEVLALTLDAEARSGGVEGMTDVGIVIANRVKVGAWGPSFSAVCLAPKQFSCWNPSADKNHVRLVGYANLLKIGQVPSELEPAMSVAAAVIEGTAEDQVGGADHYLTTRLFKTNPPSWAAQNHDRVTADRNGHTFLRLRQDERRTA